jgi:hypothetical protein
MKVGNPEKWIITKWSNPADRTETYSDVMCPACWGSEICPDWTWQEAQASEELFDSPPAGWDCCDHCGATWE